MRWINIAIYGGGIIISCIMWYYIAQLLIKIFGG